MSLVPLSGPSVPLMESLRAERVSQSDAQHAITQFLTACGPLTREERQVQFDQLLSLVDESAPGPACFLSVVCGALLEQGAWPGRMGEIIHRLLDEILPQTAYFARELTRLGPSEELPGFTNDAEEEEFFRERHQKWQLAFSEISAALPLARQAWDRFDVLWPACIALYCVDAASRSLGRKYLSVIAPMAVHHEGASWMGTILPVLEREQLLVIDLERNIGITATMSGIVEINQLHGLLLDVFPRRWLERRRIDPAAVAILEGRGPQESDLTIESSWQFYRGTALRGNGRLPSRGDIHSPYVMEGHELPSSLPEIAGHRVILIGRYSHRRSWRCVRRFKSLPAGLSDVVVLNHSSIQDWLQQIQSLEMDYADASELNPK